MEVNYFGLVATTKAFLPLARAHKGRIVNVGSGAGLVASGLFGVYSPTKFALEGFSDSLRKELRPLGVAVVIVDPGVVITPIWGKLGQSFEDFPIDEQALSLYGRYFIGADEKTAQLLALGDTTQVTDVAIVDAITVARPKARYFVANFGGIHTLVWAFLVRVLPTYLFDVIMESL